jgi:hypothetical protein
MSAVNNTQPADPLAVLTRATQPEAPTTPGDTGQVSFLWLLITLLH